MKKHILKFSAAWCNPCKIMAAALDKLALDIDIVEDDVDSLDTKGKEYGIRSIPTLICFEDGVEVFRINTVPQLDKVVEWANAK